jgi:exopolysaccharide production protein ExoQ
MSMHTMTGGAPPWTDTAGTLESLFRRVAGWVPVLTFFYVLIVWPFAFANPEPSIAEQALGWTASTPAPATSAWKQIAYPLLFIVAAAAFLATASYRRFVWAHAGVLLLAFLIAYALASTAWSAAPEITIMRAILFAMIVFLIALSAYASPSSEQIVRRLFWVMALVTALNAAALVVKKPSEIGHMGIYEHKNVFGWVSALVLYFGLYRLFTGTTVERIVAALMVAAAPVFLVAAESKTSLGLAVLCPAVGLALWYGARRVRVSPAIVFAVLVVFVGFVFEIGRASGTWDLFAVNRTIFGNTTLTGRTEIWSFTLGLIWQKPLFGHGYEAVFSTGAGGLVERNAVGFVRGMPTAHNGYLDMWVQLGIVGLAAVVLFLLAAFDAVGRWAFARPGMGWLAITIVLFASMHNLLESDLMISSNPLSMIVLLMFFLALRDGREGRRSVGLPIGN